MCVCVYIPFLSYSMHYLQSLTQSEFLKIHFSQHYIMFNFVKLFN